jgi:D-alanine-D-alanine ligase
MKVAVIYNKKQAEASDVINIFGPQTMEKYNPQTVELVTSALEKGGHNVKQIEGNINVAEALYEFMPRVMAGERPGMVFNMAYGIQGQSRYTHIPAMLEMLGIPYVGSGPQAHAVALDKIMSKILFQQHNLATPSFWFFSSPDEDMKNVVYPVIVKPKMEAVSMGLRIVDNEKDLRKAVQYIIETFQQQALVESFISGREFAVGLLGSGADQEVLPIVEFDLKGDPNAIQTVDAKMSKPMEKICPAQISNELAAEMRRLAQGAFYALGINDFGRVDLRMDQKGNMYLLELNSMASLGHTGSYVRAAQEAGYDFNALVNRMLDVAAVRYFGESYFPLASDEDKTSEKTQPLRIRIRSYLRSNQTTMEEMLRKMVEINTHVHNSEGVNDLGNLMTRQLQQLGFKKEIFPQVEVGNSLYFTNHDSGKNDILLWNHLDNRSSYQDYFSFHGERGRFFGSGVAENKGGLTVMLSALKALRFTRSLKKINCGILLTTDYSLGGSLSKDLIDKLSRQSICVAGLKWGEAHGGVVTSCFGRAGLQFEFSNVKTPSNPKASDVITTLCKKIVSAQKLSSPESNIDIIPFTMEAQTTLGKTPDYAIVSFGLQFSDKDNGDNLISKIRSIFRKNLGTNLKLRVKQLYYRPPVIENEKIIAFYDGVKRLADLLEVRVAPFAREITSEISYVPENIPVLDGLGPLGGSTRSPNEYIIQDSLIDRSLLLAMIIYRCGKGTL